MAKIIDGKMRAKIIRDSIKEEVVLLKKQKGITPKLCVILVGGDPASQIYVRNKEKACAEVGIESETLRIPPSIKEDDLILEVKRINEDKNVDGLLVQLPLPGGLNTQRVLDTVSFEKDVDGLHPLNMGKLLRGEKPLFVPCTPAGVMDLILSTGETIAGKEAVVVGRSSIVGKPMALLLLQEHATVTLCHSKTTRLAEITRRADILVAAIGRAKMITAEMVKEGAIVIDVGMNREEGGLVGDVDFLTVSQKAGYITPVPGGVGPMTIAMLLKNTLVAARRRGESLS